MNEIITVELEQVFEFTKCVWF